MRKFEKLKERHPEAQFTIQMIRGIKERFASVADEMERAVVELPVKGKPTEFDLTEELREACRRMVPPIVEGLGDPDSPLCEGLLGAPG